MALKANTSPVYQSPIQEKSYIGTQATMTIKVKVINENSRTSCIVLQEYRGLVVAGSTFRATIDRNPSE